MKNRYLSNIMRFGFATLVGATVLSGCNDDDSVKNTAARKGITIIEENYGAVTRSGASPIIYQESIDLGDGIFMDVTLQEDFGPAESLDPKTRAEISEGEYTILGYYKDGRYAGANTGTVSFTEVEGVRTGTFLPTDDFKFHTGDYDFVCIKNVTLSDARDAAFVTRGTAKTMDGSIVTPDAALISEKTPGTIDGTSSDGEGNLDIQFIMKHKESGIRFNLVSPGEFKDVGVTISVPNPQPYKHKYSLPSLVLYTEKTESSIVDDIKLTINGGEQFTPYEYFLPGTDATAMTITFDGGTVWGKPLINQVVTLTEIPVLEANTRYTATINFRDGLPAFEGIIAIGSDGKLTLEGHKDEGARTVFFKGGSVIANGSKRANWKNSEGVNQVVFNPSGTTSFANWTDIPNGPSSSITETFHTTDNINLGHGDPCRLVGLSLADINKGIIDNGLWKLPTQTDYATSGAVGDWIKPTVTSAEDRKGNGYKIYGGRLVTIGGDSFFHPALGERRHDEGTLISEDNYARYWSSTNTGYNDQTSKNKFSAMRADYPNETNSAGKLEFGGVDSDRGYAVRCVRRPVPGTGGTDKVPAFDYIIAIGKDGKLTVTAETDNDTEARTVYFKFGSTIAQSSSTNAWSASEVVFNGSNNTDADYNAWIDVPYQTADVTHTLDDVQNGKGDPCRLVGLSESDVKAGIIDNGLWRMPSNSSNNWGGDSWVQHNSYNGRKITVQSDNISKEAFYPAAGYRKLDNGTVEGQTTSANYWWLNSSNESGNSQCISFTETNIYRNQSINISQGNPIRCVSQVHKDFPAFKGIIALGIDGKLTVDGTAGARTIYFKYGSLVGIAATSYDIYGNERGSVVYNPTDDTYGSYSNIPYSLKNPITHNNDSVAIGKGDPCRLVGLTVEQIKSGTIDNGKWRLPTYEECDNDNKVVLPVGEWGDVNGQKGKYISFASYASMFYPALGLLYLNGSFSGVNSVQGYYMVNANEGRHNMILKAAEGGYELRDDNVQHGVSVRCVSPQ